MNRILKGALTVVAATVGATAARFLFSSNLGSRVPFLFYVLAIAVAAQIAGTVAGLVVTALSIVLIYYPAPASDVYMPTVLAIFALVGTALSVTGGWQKRLKDELHLAYERIALKQEVSRMGSFEWFVDGDRFVASPEMKTIYGITPPNHVDTFEEWKAFIHPEDRAGTLAGLEETAGQKLPTFDATYRIVRADKEVRWVHSRRKLHYDDSGTLIRVVGINMDVTDLKQGEMAQQILGGLLQICSACRRVHDAKAGEWYSMEGYLRLHSTAKLSHGMCPDCGRQWYADDSGEDGEKARSDV